MPLIPSCQSAITGLHHAKTHSHKNQVKAEKAWKAFISATNADRIRRIDRPVHALAASLRAFQCPGGTGITQVVNRNQNLPATNGLLTNTRPFPPSTLRATAPMATASPPIHRSEARGSKASTSILIPAAHAATEETAMMPTPPGDGADVGSQIENAGHRAIASGFCGVVRRNPMGALVAVGGTALVGIGGAISYALTRGGGTPEAADLPEAIDPPEPLPQPEMQTSRIRSSEARSIHDGCNGLIGRFTTLSSQSIDQVLDQDLAAIRSEVSGIKNVRTDGINARDARIVARCVGIQLRTSKVVPLINRLEGIKRTVQESSDLSIVQAISVLRKDALVRKLDTTLNSLKTINQDLYNLTINLNNRILQEAG